MVKCVKRCGKMGGYARIIMYFYTKLQIRNGGTHIDEKEKNHGVIDDSNVGCSILAREGSYICG